MPQRPSKKPKVRPGSKAGAAPDADGTVQASQQRHREKTTKMILGKFQGRKSI